MATSAVSRPESAVYLSVIIPAYNEQSRIESSLLETSEYLARLGQTWDILVVDDGSQDRTPEIVRSWAQRQPACRLLTLPRNEGKGSAVRHGMLAARGAYRMFRDADNSTHIHEFSRFRPLLEAGQPVVIGSRRVPGARTVQHQPFPREFLGRGFAFFCRQFLGLAVRDFTCGFKCFSAQAANEIFARQRIRRWAFDAEILFLAHKAGYTIVEVPITWSDDRGSKVRVGLDVARSFVEVLSIRLNWLLGRYAPRPASRPR